jgi:DNA modification methylase
MKTRIMQGCVFEKLPTITPGSVDIVVTSPPYWLLRSYLKKYHPLKHLELGQEATPQEYVENQVKVLRLVRECLADHGTVWLNMGDSYATGGSGSRANPGTLDGRPNSVTTLQGEGRKDQARIESGNLCLIPQRLAIALQDDGWYVRSVVVWHKPAPMPASIKGWRWEKCRVKVKSKDLDTVNGQKSDVSSGPPQKGLAGHSGGAGVFIPAAEWADCPGCAKCRPNKGLVLRRGSWRPTSSWEPILMLAKTDRYFCDGEAVKLPPSAATVQRDLYSRILDDPDEQFAARHDHETICDGANPRDVQTWASEPLREKHYAAFPTKLVEFCLRAGTSAKGYCSTCGKPWVRILQSKSVPHPHPRSSEAESARMSGAGFLRSRNQANGSASLAPETKTLGWKPSCSCAVNDPRPALVLDPFAGSGRTGVTSQLLGLDFVGCELNPDYVRMADKILRDAMPLFASSELI